MLVEGLGGLLVPFPHTQGTRTNVTFFALFCLVAQADFETVDFARQVTEKNKTNKKTRSNGGNNHCQNVHRVTAEKEPAYC